MRERWEEPQLGHIGVLLECFKYYEVGSPGGSVCSAFFNVMVMLYSMNSERRANSMAFFLSLRNRERRANSMNSYML